MKNINEFHANKLKTMLVDGDLLAYKITSALEEAIEWEDDVWTLHCNLDHCKQFWKQSIAYYMRHTNSAMAIICFSDVSNFRKELDLEYKSFRKSIRKPVAYKPLRLWIEETHRCTSFPYLEGDDTLGLLATGKYKNNCVIVSGDKDMRTIPSWHCFIIDDSIELVNNTKADLNFGTQVLTGDKSDGYIGCKGVGNVKASRVLSGKKKLPQMWEAVLREYLNNGYTVDDAYHQSRLARILRHGEYDIKKEKPKLWSYKYDYYRNFDESRKASK